MAPRRPPPKATPDYLERAALYYLDRYAAPVAHLRRLLRAKLSLSLRAHGGDAEAGRAAIEALLARLVASGVLDDATYAQSHARALQRRGASLRAIRARLAAKGTPKAAIEAAIAELESDSGDSDLAAALAYARRRRFGPFRPAHQRAERRLKDLAAMNRQGFAYAVARRIIDAEDVGELEGEIATAPD